MPPCITRRRFLHTSAAAGAAGFWSGHLLGAAAKGANERLHVGIVGVAGRGADNWKGVRDAGAEIVAICDVDEKRTGDIRKLYPEAAFYADFRKLVEQKGLDAVVISTPDHTHASATLAALRAGLHVYCEKPLTHTVAEARLVAETAAKHKRITQMGTQIHAGSNYRRIVELVQGGAIGTVKEVHTWCGRSWGGGDRPADMPPIPQGLHYDLWLGPAPYRPYHTAYVPYHWRGWWDFGGGTLNDMACHHMDLPYWALKLRYPTSVVAEGPAAHPETTAKWLIVHYEFPARGTLPAVKLTWYDGGKRPKHFEEKGLLPQWGDGNLFVGDKGMLLADYNKHLLLPRDKFADFTRPEPSIPDSIGHHKEWVEACKTGGTTTCNFDYSGGLAEAVLLGTVSYRIGGKQLTWDAKNLKATNEPAADKFIRKEYRKGWELPA